MIYMFIRVNKKKKKKKKIEPFKKNDPVNFMEGRNIR